MRHTKREEYEQVRAYGLPAAEGKRGDPRWPAFARRYGFDVERPVQWEGEGRRWSRTNSSAWSSPPSTRTSTATSSSGRSPGRNNSAAP
ncbi:hypothetical protein ACODT3_39715 [Streptomyces sp. 4.24]|uniref:hypothetical protein n=1 Tax=Streptomyces tritrimontium TaxID=3406573 RepID=UPI003BB718FA